MFEVLSMHSSSLVGLGQTILIEKNMEFFAVGYLTNQV